MRRLIAVVAIFVVAACGGGPEILEPDPDETSASPEPTTTPPEMSDQASEDSNEGAVAAAHHWVKLLNYAAITGDTSELEQYSEGCSPCMTFADGALNLTEDERPSADVWSIKEAEVMRSDAASDVKFELELLGGEASVVAFELSAHPPFSITDLYRVID